MPIQPRRLDQAHDRRRPLTAAQQTGKKPVLRLCRAPHKRKNWLFSDTPKGATASVQIYSLIETAKANGRESYAWLCHVLERLPAANSVEDIEALLPWNCTLAPPQ